jgi:hypothetical protein
MASVESYRALSETPSRSSRFEIRFSVAGRRKMRRNALWLREVPWPLFSITRSCPRATRSPPPASSPASSDCDTAKGDYFAPVRVNKQLTLLFDEETKFESHHYAFHVSKAEFDAILGAHQEGGDCVRQRALEPRRRGAQRLERRPRCLFQGSERSRAGADDGPAVIRAGTSRPTRERASFRAGRCLWPSFETCRCATLHRMRPTCVAPNAGGSPKHGLHPEERTR